MLESNLLHHARVFIGWIVLAGCAHDGAPTVSLRPDLVTLRDATSKIVLCETTEDELRKRLGAPFRDGRVGQGRVLSWLPQPDSVSTHYLAVLVREQGGTSVVVDEYFDVPTELTWVPVDRCGLLAPGDGSSPRK
jgi:hypothetical protein